MSAKGTKNDKGKAPISLIPRQAVVGIAEALDFGAKKYDRYNFMNGIEYTRLTDAAMRHVLAFLDGEDLDKESGLNHIKHAAANLCMLLYMIDKRQEMDDRYKGTVTESIEDLVMQAIEEMRNEGFHYGKSVYNVETVNPSNERPGNESQRSIGGRADKFESTDGGDQH